MTNEDHTTPGEGKDESEGHNHDQVPVDGEGVTGAENIGENVQKKSRKGEFGVGAVGVAGALTMLGSLKGGNDINPETGKTEQKKWGFGRVLGVAVGVVVTAASIVALAHKDAKNQTEMVEKFKVAFTSGTYGLGGRA